MVSLKKIQEDFAKHIYDPNNIDALDLITPGAIRCKDRLQIYRNNIFTGFEDALRGTYTLVMNLVGDDYFLFLAAKYNEKYKSRSGNMEDFGEYFPDLLDSLLEHHKLSYLGDVARFEWLKNQSYFEKNANDINLEKLQSLSEDEFMKLSFELHPTVRILSSKYPIYSIWEMSTINTHEGLNIEENAAEFILIQRVGLTVSIHKLLEAEYIFLEMMQGGNNIFQIYEVLAKKNSDFDIGSCINKFVHLKIITNFRILK